MGGMVKCLQCGVILHSMYRHDFQSCSCGNNTFVDGGEDYSRIGGMDFNKIKTIKHGHDCDTIIIDERTQ